MSIGRPKKYITEEQIKERNREINDKKLSKKLANAKPEDVKTLHKKKSINEKDGFVITIETFNRLRLDNIVICFTVNYKYCDGVRWTYVKTGILKVIKDWLNSQNVYDNKNKIFIFEHPEDNSHYNGEYRSYSFQLYLRRYTQVESRLWKHMYPEVLPLVDAIKTHIKNTSPEEGIEIVRRLSYNWKIREKTLLSEADDA